MRLALKSWSGAVTFLKTGFLADFWSLESFAARAPFLNFKTSAMTKRNLIDLMSSITKSVSQISLCLSPDAIFVHRGKGGAPPPPQYPATPIHDIMDGLKRGEKGEHTELFTIT